MLRPAVKEKIRKVVIKIIGGKIKAGKNWKNSKNSNRFAFKLHCYS
jgi:hypothetical protein